MSNVLWIQWQLELSNIYWFVYWYLRFVFISRKMSIDFTHRIVAMWHFLPHYFIICHTSLSCTIFSHFSPLWNVLYVINSYKRSIAAFDDVCLLVLDGLNVHSATKLWLFYSSFSFATLFPQQSIISSMAISESQRTERPGC